MTAVKLKSLKSRGYSSLSSSQAFAPVLILLQLHDAARDSFFAPIMAPRSVSTVGLPNGVAGEFCRTTVVAEPAPGAQTLLWTNRQTVKSASIQVPAGKLFIAVKLKGLPSADQ